VGSRYLAVNVSIAPVVFVAAFSVPYRGVVASAQRPVGSGFGAATAAAEVLEGIDLTGRLAVVTGGYSGIGLETTRALVGAGARVVVPARRPVAAAEVLAGVDGVEIDELDPAISTVSRRSPSGS
jgi:short chain dehydrogenase